MPEENRIFAKSRHQPTRTVQGGATLCKCMVYEKVEFFIFQSKTMRTWSSDRKWFGLQRVQRRLTRTTSLTEVMFPCRTAPWTRPKPEVSAILFIPCRRRPLPQDLSSLSVWKIGLCTKVTSEAEVIRRAQWGGKTVHFATWWTSQELRDWEKFLKYKGRVVLRGDIVEDESRYAVCVEQGASASHFIAAEVLDASSRLPGCSGLASDAVSAYTQVEMKDAPELLRLSEEECPKIWIRIPKARRPHNWDSIDDPVVLVERNLWSHPPAGFLWERKWEKF